MSDACYCPGCGGLSVRSDVSSDGWIEVLNCTAGHRWEVESAKTRERKAFETKTIEDAVRAVLVRRGCRPIMVRGFSFEADGVPPATDLSDVADEAMEIARVALGLPAPVYAAAVAPR